jgi:hypothetical protein
MKLKFTLCCLLMLTLCNISAQLPNSSFSFSCSRTSTACDSNCFSVRVTVPNLRASTSSYSIQQSGRGDACFANLTFVPGTPTFNSLNFDDKYSGVIQLPFAFPFYEASFRSLVAASNGYISFDTSYANRFSHYAILNSNSGLTAGINGLQGENLPSSLFDRGLIMFPFHDLNPPQSLPGLNKLSYAVIGTAPHRKWILTMAQLALFDCDSLSDNTQQLVLYEGTGIVEVLVRDRQICPTWNKGRAMIGMQDTSRTKGIMPPGRAATDSGWGGIGINEGWRFIPAAGNSLFKSAELYNGNGQLLSANADTSSQDNGVLRISFNNICGDTSSTYLVKTVFRKIDDTLSEVYGVDTLHISRINDPGDTLVWVGNLDDNWENPGNWPCSSTPSERSNVIVNNGTIHIRSNVTVNSLKLMPGARVDVAPGYRLMILSDH